MASMFVTSSESRYIFDSVSKLITGGSLGDMQMPYIPEQSKIFIGSPALIYLQNGRLLRTSTVTGIM